MLGCWAEPVVHHVQTENINRAALDQSIKVAEGWGTFLSEQLQSVVIICHG